MTSKTVLLKTWFPELPVRNAHSSASLNLLNQKLCELEASNLCFTKSPRKPLLKTLFSSPRNEIL